MRPVYEVLGFDNLLYLSYDGEYWQVSDGWVEEDMHRHIVFRVQDTALRPEYITGIWNLNANETMLPLPDLHLRCSGFETEPDGACTMYYPCRNHARCKYIPYTDSKGELLCMCPPTNQGPACEEQVPECTRKAELNAPENTLFYSQNGYRLGDVRTYFCSPTSKQNFFFSKCESIKTSNKKETDWVWHGNCEPDETSASLKSTGSLLVMPMTLLWGLLCNQ